MKIQKYSYQTDWGICYVESKHASERRHLKQPYGTAQFPDSHFPIKISSCANELAYKNDNCIRKNSDILSIEFVTKGSFTICEFGQTREVKENEIFFVQPGCEYCKFQTTSDYAEKWYVVMTGPLLKQTLQLLGLEREIYLRPIDPGLLMEYISRIYELLKLPTLQNYRCACAECYSMLLEIAAQNTAKKQPEELREAIDYMQSNVNHPLNLAMITEHCKISRISLYRSFKKHFKQSPFDYFLELKMKRAIQLLKMQVYSVKQIASELNYSSPQYFAMEFKKRYGMTPSQFQKNEQKNM